MQITGGPRHRTMSAMILEEVRKRIMDGTYKAGAQLRQDGLAEEFGVSRIPVREALFQLEAEGLARISPHKGATVSGFSASEAAEAFDLRALLEPKLLAASAPGLTEADFAEADEVLTRYSAALENGDTAVWGVLNTSFHQLLYRRAGRPRTQGIVSSLLQECDRYTRLQLSADRAELERADQEHREMLALCRAGKFAPACILLQRHLEHVAASLGSFLHAMPQGTGAEL